VDKHRAEDVMSSVLCFKKQNYADKESQCKHYRTRH